MADEKLRGIDGLAEFVASREPGERNPGLFWAACRAAEDNLNPWPLVTAAAKTGMSRAQAERTVASAERTIARARREHRPVKP
jgi:hypothetical protein